MSFRFLHTADWQIGKPFAQVEGDAGAELRAERLNAVERLAALARDRLLDAVLVAGDVFDSNEVEDRTINRTIEQMKGFAGPWVLLPGNHDAALSHSVWTRARAMQMPANIIIADRPEAVAVWGDRAVVLPAPLRRRRETDDQTEWFDAAQTAPGAIRVGLAHGTLPGRLPEAAEAQNHIAADRAERARLDYLALGDWHGQLRIADRTWYAGTPETDRHRDNLSGAALLVEIDAPGAEPKVESIATGGFSWHRLQLELTDGRADRVIEALANLAEAAHRRVVTLRLSGAISLSERFRLEQELSAWRARLHSLEADLGALLEQPTLEDLDELDMSGFVRLAVERLKAEAQSGSTEQAALARTALRMIYLDHRQAGEGR
jgi:DNA repair exonuclease SbcCD nuclease subunit